MKRFYNSFYALLIALFIVPGNSIGQKLFSQKNTALLEQSVDEIMKGFTARTPGASVLILKNDTIIFQKGYGIKQVGQRGRIDPYTNFRLASVTKQFTAAS